ncbi:MAG: oxidative demethylase [Methylobacteriaceae bacterium]|nr:oxidative demethylase [Methylobacteriaceae bacterium]
MIELAPGLIYHPDYLDRAAQEQLLTHVRDIIREAPLFTPRMPRTGKAFSVRTTNLRTARLGVGPGAWLSLSGDASGHRRGLAALPARALAAWQDIGGYAPPPQRGWPFGIDRIMPSTSTLLAEGGRFNLTLRRVTLPA